jgi:starch phosphorylase
MVREYTEKLYLPSAKAYHDRQKNNGQAGNDIIRWQQQIAAHWPYLHFGHLRVESDESTHHFHVPVYLDDLEPDMLRVELYADPEDAAQEPECIVMEQKERLPGTVNGFIYGATLPARRPVSDYTPRIIPWRSLALVPLEECHILWYA